MSSATECGAIVFGGNLDIARTESTPKEQDLQARPPKSSSTIAATADGPDIRLTIDGAAAAGVLLSTQQARALSLALIAAVNAQERAAHIRRVASEPAAA
jgi:hypothetical protein